MNHQKNQRRQSVLLATIATIFLLGAFDSTFAQGVGAKYGTRDPRTCSDTKAPARGAAMTAALATKYVICSSEGVQGENLYLIEDLTDVQVGGSRPYNYNNDSVADIDVTARVYPFRTGSYKSYQCGAVYEGNKGYNCNIYPVPKASGACRKSTFGDWKCTFDYQTVDRSTTENNVPPPTAAKVGATVKPTAAPKNGDQTAATKVGANEDKDNAALPPPDLSEMEKYFDISKVEYSTADRKLYFIGKMTNKNNPLDWQIDFYDADEIKVVSTKYCLPESGDYEQVGGIAKYYFDLPPESKWKFVKKVVITKWKQ